MARRHAQFVRYFLRVSQRSHTIPYVRNLDDRSGFSFARVVGIGHVKLVQCGPLSNDSERFDGPVAFVSGFPHDGVAEAERFESPLALLTVQCSSFPLRNGDSFFPRAAELAEEGDRVAVLNPMAVVRNGYALDPAGEVLPVGNADGGRVCVYCVPNQLGKPDDRARLATSSK